MTEYIAPEVFQQITTNSRLYRKGRIFYVVWYTKIKDETTIKVMEGWVDIGPR